MLLGTWLNRNGHKSVVRGPRARSHGSQVIASSLREIAGNPIVRKIQMPLQKTALSELNRLAAQGISQSTSEAEMLLKPCIFAAGERMLTGLAPSQS